MGVRTMRRDKGVRDITEWKRDNGSTVEEGQGRTMGERQGRRDKAWDMRGGIVDERQGRTMGERQGRRDKARAKRG